MPVCPYHVHTNTHVVKRGFYAKRSGPKRKIQRYICRHCCRYFSSQTGTLTYRDRKPHLYRMVWGLLVSSTSQRRISWLLNIHQETVARKMVRLGAHFDRINTVSGNSTFKNGCIIFDELETYEHTKCKPLSIPLVVHEPTRKIIAIDVLSMPASGHLAAISRKKYGPRKDERSAGLTNLLKRIKPKLASTPNFKSDKCPRYGPALRKVFKTFDYAQYLGRKPSVAGLGELKKGAFDPLFMLNHTAAMVRDNTKCMARKTWCSTKRPDRLLARLHIYIWFHNHWVEGAKFCPDFLEPVLN